MSAVCQVLPSSVWASQKMPFTTSPLYPKYVSPNTGSKWAGPLAATGLPSCLRSGKLLYKGPQWCSMGGSQRRLPRVQNSYGRIAPRPYPSSCTGRHALEGWLSLKSTEGLAALGMHWTCFARPLAEAREADSGSGSSSGGGSSRFLNLGLSGGSGSTCLFWRGSKQPGGGPAQPSLSLRQRLP